MGRRRLRGESNIKIGKHELEQRPHHGERYDNPNNNVGHSLNLTQALFNRIESGFYPVEYLHDPLTRPRRRNLLLWGLGLWIENSGLLIIILWHEFLAIPRDLWMHTQSN